MTKKQIALAIAVGFVLGAVYLTSSIGTQTAINDAEDVGTGASDLTDDDGVKTDDPTDDMCQNQPDTEMPAELNAFLSRDQGDIVADLQALLDDEKTFPTTITDPPDNADCGVQTWLLNTLDTNWEITVVANKGIDAEAQLMDVSIHPKVVTTGIPMMPVVPDMMSFPPLGAWLGTDSVYANCSAIAVFETATFLDTSDTITFSLEYRATGGVLMQLLVGTGPPVTIETMDSDEAHSTLGSGAYPAEKTVSHQEFVPGGSLIRLQVVVQNDTNSAVFFIKGSATSTIPNNFTPYIPVEAGTN
jgi:hypothetical protein